jgi:hypothetical protein
MYKNRSVSRKAPMTPQTYMERGPEPGYFWSPENINHYSKDLQIMKFAINPNLLEQARDRYKWITIDYDQERDNAYFNLNKEYLSSWSKKPKKRSDGTSLGRYLTRSTKDLIQILKWT